MSKLWGWIAAAAVLIGGILIAILLPDRKTIAIAKATATEKIVLPQITEHQKKLEVLSKDATKNQAEIAAVQQQLATKKEELNAAYTRQGLSSEEVAARLRRVRL